MPSPSDATAHPTRAGLGLLDSGAATVSVPTVRMADWAAVLRGLSAIFWGLPVALLAVARHFLVLWPTIYDLVLPPLAAGIVLYGVGRLHRLHPRERIWQRAILETETLALIATGLAPFLFLWNRVPEEAFFARAVGLMLAVSLGLLVSLTRTLSRLAALLPDEPTRADARLFHGITRYLVLVLFGVVAAVAVREWPSSLTRLLALPREPVGFARQALLLLLTLIPVAMAMAVTWKLKEVVLGILIGRRS